MATMNLATLLVRLKADTGGYKRNLKGAGRSTSKFGKVASTALKGLVVGGFAAATAAAAKFAHDSVKEFQTFENAAAEVFTLMPDLSAEATDSMRGDMLAFGAEVGRMTDETIPAFYQAISAGVPRENVFDFMEIASDAALGGVTDLETAVDGLTSVVNAYGEGAIDAQEASDILFTGIRLGKTTYDELAASISDVTPLAAALGVKFGDVTAALAAMTSQGTNTNKATTQLRALLQELSKAGTEADQTFRQVAGVGFADFIAQGNDLSDALAILEEQSAETNVPIQDMFGSVEAGLAALQLSGQGAEVFAANLAEVENAAGATGEAAATMAGSIAHAERLANAATQELKVLLGEALIPVRKAWLDLVTTLANAASEHLNEQKAIKAVESDAQDLIDTLLDLNDAHDTTGTAVERINQRFGAMSGNVENSEARIAALDAAMGLLEHGFEGNGHQLAETAIRIAETDSVTRTYTADIIDAALAQRDIEVSTGDATSAIEDQGDALSDAEKLAQDFNLAGRETVDTTGEIAANARHVTNEYREQQKEAERTAEATRKYEQALADAEAALGSYFEKALDGQDINEDLLDQFLSIAAQQGANAQELRNIAAATGNYSDEQINTAVTSATLHTEFTKVTEAWAAGRITADQATAAINLLEQGERDTANAAIGLATTMNTTVAGALHGTQQNALDTKLGVEDMSDTMGEVPPVTVSTFDDKGTYFDAFQDADRLLNKLNLLDGKTTTSTHTTNFITTGGGPTGGPGLQHGGFTGNVPVNQPAGIVHGQEFVFSAPAVRNVGVNFLSDLHDAARQGNAAQMPGGGGNVTFEQGAIVIAPQTPMQARPEELAGAIGRHVVGRG